MWAEKRTQAWLFRLTCVLFLLCLGRKLEVQWDENGNLTLVGRCTDMVKIHGNRVEPAEIESVFKRLTGAGWAAVRAFAEEGSSGLLCVYYTDALSLDEDALRHRMEVYLPYYMIPSCFLRIEEIPLRPNGKLDRKALPAPDPRLLRRGFVPPEGAASGTAPIPMWRRPSGWRRSPPACFIRRGSLTPS